MRPPTWSESSFEERPTVYLLTFRLALSCRRLMITSNSCAEGRSCSGGGGGEVIRKRYGMIASNSCPGGRSCSGGRELPWSWLGVCCAEHAGPHAVLFAADTAALSKGAPTRSPETRFSHAVLPPHSSQLVSTLLSGLPPSRLLPSHSSPRPRVDMHTHVGKQPSECSTVILCRQGQHPRKDAAQEKKHNRPLKQG
eukprot:355791-Chlamydomonas_euryale.AAC.14